MNKDELLTDWNDAIDNGTFVTGKHDPSSVGTPYPGYRTVTVKSQAEIQGFLASGDYTLRRYHNNNYPQSPDYIEIVPAETSMVAGSGIQPNSPVPTTACDRFVAVSGRHQGWHLYAEQSTNIHNKSIIGDLTYLYDIS
jgi:hypothetical protein